MPEKTITRIRFMHTHRDTGTLLRAAPEGTVCGDWFVRWDHDPTQQERLVWLSNTEPVAPEPSTEYEATRAAILARMGVS